MPAIRGGPHLERPILPIKLKAHLRRPRRKQGETALRPYPAAQRPNGIRCLREPESSNPILPAVPSDASPVPVQAQTFPLALRSSTHARSSVPSQNTPASFPIRPLPVCWYRKPEVETARVKPQTHLASLELLDGAHPRSIPIDHAPFVIGRSPECSLVLPQTFVSRRHAEITGSGTHFLLRDLGSLHGTFVNRTRVVEHLLLPFDIVQFGSHEGPQLQFGSGGRRGSATETMTQDSVGRPPADESSHLGHGKAALVPPRRPPAQ